MRLIDAGLFMPERAEKFLADGHYDYMSPPKQSIFGLRTTSPLFKFLLAFLRPFACADLSILAWTELFKIGMEGADFRLRDFAQQV